MNTATAENKIMYTVNAQNFSKIPGSPIAYWVSNDTLAVYCNPSLSKYIVCKSGIMTGSEDFIRLWFESSIYNIKFDCQSHLDMGDYTWFPLNSGGEFRKWYGNNLKIINLWHNGATIKATIKNYRLRDERYYFKEGITWGRITSSQIAFREVVAGSLFGDAGPIGFISNKRKYVLAFLCSKVVKSLTQVTNPTLNFQVHDIMNLPLCLSDDYEKDIENLAQLNINISKSDWDSFETSWDFKKHPLI